MRRALGLLLVLAMVLAACGGDDDDGGTAARSDTAGTESDDGSEEADAGGEADADGDGGGGGVAGCNEVFPEAEAEAFLEAPVEEDVSEPLEVLDAECVWAADSESGLRLLQVRIYRGPQFFDPDIHSDMEGFEALDGIGDGAYLWEMGIGLSLQALVDDRTLDLTMSGFDRDGADLDRATVRQRLIDTAERITADM